MTMFRVVLAPSAENDVADAYRWYKERNGTAADAFRTEVFAVLDRLAEAPLSWPADEDGNRKRAIKRFPFSVWFEVHGDQVTVLAIAHHRRRPGYWRK